MYSSRWYASKETILNFVCVTRLYNRLQSYLMSMNIIDKSKHSYSMYIFSHNMAQLHLPTVMKTHILADGVALRPHCYLCLFYFFNYVLITNSLTSTVSRRNRDRLTVALINLWIFLLRRFEVCVFLFCASVKLYSEFLIMKQMKL